MRTKTFQCAVITALFATVSVSFAQGRDAYAKSSAAIGKEQQEWGIAGDSRAAKRIIEIKMLDTMRFSPRTISVKQGETVPFVIRNEGKMLHEFVIGTKRALDEHAALMVKFPKMKHHEPYMARVAPGGKEDLVWRFNRAGQFDFAWLIPGHYQARMVGTIKVSAT